MSESPSIVGRQPIGAGAAGAGVGTVLIAVLSGLPEGPVKSSLILLAPAMSAVLAAVAPRLVAEWTNQMSSWRIDRLAKRAATAIDSRLTGPHTSEEHKATLRKLYEELDRAVAEFHMNRVRSVALVTGDRIRELMRRIDDDSGK